MKIYPNNKTVEEKTLVDISDIPLSFISTTFDYKDVVVKFNNELLSLNKKESLKLYDKIGDELLFKDNYEIAKENVDYTKSKDGTLSITTTSKKSPYRANIFGYKYIVERMKPYSSTYGYKLRLAFHNNQSIKPVLKEAKKPPNIEFAYYDEDEYADVMFYDSEQEYFDALKNNVTKTNINIHVIAGVSFNTYSYQNEVTTYTIKDPLIYNTREYTMPNGAVYLDTTTINTLFSPASFDYVTLSEGETPFLLLKDKVNHQWLIIVSPAMMTKKEAMQPLIEHIMYAYVHGFYHIPEHADGYINSWISNNIVDYEYSLNNKLSYYHPHINVKDDMEKYHNRYDLTINYRVVDIVVSTNNVEYSHIDSAYNVFFNSKFNNEPIKDSNEQLIYTINQELKFIDPVNYSLYRIEQLPTINYDDNDGVIKIKVGPYYSSKNNIAKHGTTTLVINDVNSNYVLYMKKTSVYDDQEYYLLKEGESSNDIKIADIIVIRSEKIKPLDIRVLGGGSSKYDDYELIDVGNILGRPYRLGTVLVITLPKKYEQYRAQLQAQIDKHISSSEAAILVFKDNNN